MDDRKAFDAAYGAIPTITTTRGTAWLIWLAATKAERERCADICDQHATCEGIAQKCAEAIRKG